MLARLADVVDRHDARIVSQTVFHLADHRPQIVGMMERSPGGIHWPITWLEDGEGVPTLVGTQVHAVCGLDVETLERDGRAIGCVYEDTSARYCVLGDLRDPDASRPPGAQARHVFDEISATLARAGMRFANVARTWFFNDDILAWYDEFNRVRTAFFAEQEVFDGLVPASTGIGARNPFGAALVGGGIAVEPKDDAVRTVVVRSPLQSSARDYGSSFSRAAEIIAPDHRRLFISGTASISSDGATQHVGDVDAQIDLTMRVAEAILTSRGMGWSDVVRGVAYIRRPADAPAFGRYCADHGIPDSPILLTCNTVCRDDLLFEIEAEAIIGAAPRPTE